MSECETESSRDSTLIHHSIDFQEMWKHCYQKTLLCIREYQHLPKVFEIFIIIIA